MVRYTFGIYLRVRFTVRYLVRYLVQSIKSNFPFGNDLVFVMFFFLEEMLFNNLAGTFCTGIQV